MISSTSPDPDGITGSAVAATTRNTYDTNGNITSTTDPLGKTTRYEYNARNQKTKSIDAAGAVTKFEYDRLGNMSALMDSVGNRTTFQYDSRQRLIVETDPLGKSIRYKYDAADNLIQKTDRNDRATLYIYDDLNRLSREEWIGDNGQAVNIIRYSYDQLGNPLTITDNFSALTYTYDSRNRVKTVDNQGTPNAPQVVLTYTYDDNGNVLSVTDTISGNAGATTNYQYDALDRLKVLSQSGSNVSAKRVDFAYNQLGQYTSLDRYSDLAGTQLVIGTSYSYDEMSRLTAIDHRNNSGTAVSFFHYDYDTASRIKRITDIDGTVDYNYDRQDQLTAANYSDPTRADETYQYDANGNRISSYLHGTGYVTGPGNRLLSDGTYNYEYDGEGNTIKRTRISGTEVDGSTVREFTWDHRDRLLSVVDKLANGNATAFVTFIYDAWDRRIGKSSGGNTLAVIFDRSFVVLDFQSTNRQPNSSVMQRYFTSTSQAENLARETLGKNQWSLTDRQLSLRITVSDQSEIHLSFKYDAFGKNLNPFDSSSPPTARFLFHGDEFDFETGMYHQGLRYINLENGRYLSEDKGFLGIRDVNATRLLFNNPNTHTDYSGELSLSDVWNTISKARNTLSLIFEIIVAIDDLIDAQDRGLNRDAYNKQANKLSEELHGLTSELIGLNILIDHYTDPKDGQRWCGIAEKDLLNLRRLMDQRQRVLNRIETIYVEIEKTYRRTDGFRQPYPPGWR